MDEDVKSLLIEIRDEVRKTNEMLQSLKASALAEVEREQHELDKLNEESYAARKSEGLRLLLILGAFFAFLALIKYFDA